MKRSPSISDIFSPEFLFRGEDFQHLMLAMLKGGLSKKARDEVGDAAARFVATRAKRQGLEFAQPLSSAGEMAVAALRSEGYTVIDDVFSPSQIEDIYKYFDDKPIRYFNNGHDGSGGESLAMFENLPENTRFGYFKEADICRCPAFYQAIHNQHLLHTVATYLETMPTISTVSLWWSFPSEVPTGGMQLYHHDRGDFRSCNLFVYLSDVTETSGPHAFVKKTQNFTILSEWADKHFGNNAATLKQFWAWMENHRKSDKQVLSVFPKDQIEIITGPKGRSFLEDTRGLHKGTPPERESRLVFEIVYSTLPKYNEDHASVPRADLGPEITANGSRPIDPLVRYATRLLYSE